MTNTLLAVLAHPDDESFGLGGTLALYARKEYDVYLVCATRGEVGTVDPEHMQGFLSIAELRESELKCAAQNLGLKQVFFLGYRDSGMPGTEENKHTDAQINHSLDEVAGRVVKYIRELKPDVVLTFDPIGGYKHPDHIYIHKATTLAFEKADNASFHPESGSPFKPRALYYQIFPRWFLKASTRLMPLFGQDPTKFGRNHDINLKELAEVDFPLDVRLDVRSVSEVKREAGACHVSQGGGMQMRRGWLWGITRLFGENEDYMQAYPPIQKGTRRKKDLFEGI